MSRRGSKERVGHGRMTRSPILAAACRVSSHLQGPPPKVEPKVTTVIFKQAMSCSSCLISALGILIGGAAPCLCLFAPSAPLGTPCCRRTGTGRDWMPSCHAGTRYTHRRHWPAQSERCRIYLTQRDNSQKSGMYYLRGKPKVSVAHNAV